MNPTTEKARKPTAASAPLSSAKPLTELVAALPSVDDHPKVKEPLARSADISRELGAAKQKVREAEALLQQSGLSPDRSAAEVEATRLANGGEVGYDRLSTAQTSLDEMREQQNVLTRALELVGGQVNVARAEAQKEYSPLLKELGMPYIRRVAVALFETVLANIELQELHGHVRRRSLSPYALATVLPSNPFAPTLFVGGSEEQKQTARNIVNQLTLAGVFTEPEAEEWRGLFASA